MNPTPTVARINYVGLDVHTETIVVTLADSTCVVGPYGIVPAQTHSVDKLGKKLAEDGTEVRYVYEAGPTGFWLCRLTFAAMEYPAKSSSDRVKSDRGDALNLARQFRSRELTSVSVPDEAVVRASSR